MKSILSLTFLCSILCINAQTIPVENTSDGRYEPVFKYRGYLYCKHFASGSTIPDGLYKISFADKTKTQISVDNTISFVVDFTNINFNPVFYNEDAFLRGYGHRILELDTNDNTLVIASNISGFSRMLHEDFLITEYAIKDLRNGGIYNYPLNGNTYIMPEFSFDNGTFSWFSFKKVSDSGITTGFLGRMDENGQGPYVEEIYHLPEPNNGLHGFGPTNKPLIVNDKAIFFTGFSNPTPADPNNGTWKIKNVDLSSFSTNENLFSFDGRNFAGNYIETKDGIIFFEDYAKKFYKTNGLYYAVEKTDMPINSSNYFTLNGLFKSYDFSNNYSINAIGNSYITIGELTYFRTTDNSIHEDKIWKINGINGTPELIINYNWNYGSSPLFATNFQNNLVYYNPVEKKIYRYDGINLIIDPELNHKTSNGKTLSDYTVTGLIVDGDRLMINTSDAGLFVLDKTEILTTTETASKTISFFPNPVKDIVHFSEEVSDLKISDASGKNVLQISASVKSVNVSNLAKGVYIVIAKEKSGKPINQKIIKE